MTNAELERRRPLWSAMSDLFLDTEVRWSVPWVALAAGQSGYDAATLERIFWVEVFPLAIGNLLGIAGEWAMLDLDEASLVARAERGEPATLTRQVSGWMVEGEWRAALALAPWLSGPHAEARSRYEALDLLGRCYFETPADVKVTEQVARARERSLPLAEAWARYEPLCRDLLTPTGQPGHAPRAAVVEAVLAASR